MLHHKDKSKIGPFLFYRINFRILLSLNSSIDSYVRHSVSSNVLSSLTVELIFLKN